MPRRKRREKGSGSVYRVKVRGWCAQRELPPSPEGKRRFERAFFGRDKAAAVGQVSIWEAEKIALAKHPRAGDTVREWLEHWLRAKVATVADASLEFYHRHIDYAIPYIGHIRLIDLQPQHIRDMLSALLPQEGRPGLSSRSRAIIRAVLRQALQMAVNDGVLSRNPVIAVEAPKVEKYEAYALSTEQLEFFFAAVENSPLRAMWHILADLGPRHEEIISTRWADYNRKERTLRIRGTKTDKERYLPLTKKHVEMLDALWEYQQTQRTDNRRWKEHGYIFASEVGTKLAQSAVRRRFKTIIDHINEKEAEQAKQEGRIARELIPRYVRVHDLRHTAATHLIAAGNDIPTVQYITGHKDTSVLLEIYAHSDPERKRVAVERVEERRRVHADSVRADNAESAEITV